MLILTINQKVILTINTKIDIDNKVVSILIDSLNTLCPVDERSELLDGDKILLYFHNKKNGWQVQQPEKTESLEKRVKSFLKRQKFDTNLSKNTKDLVRSYLIKRGIKPTELNVNSFISSL